MGKKKKPVKKKPCNCLATVQKKLSEENARVVTGFGIDFSAGKSFETGPFLKLEKIEKSRKRLPELHCTFCPFCGAEK